jgi:hypothetical protein
MRTYEAVPKYDAKIVLGDVNFKKEKDNKIIGLAGKYAVHESKSENGNRHISFAEMYDLIILSTKFPTQGNLRGKICDSRN